ncbi:uncharacterized protein LOC105837745 [Monomorium pharaonis]|uniref:uncharacterized protein LOC105837745 n=1 Tax=Monomorium pharaonis TaxID=307658 RepID=UPI0017479BAE|nr:uncharacterized protein LOC105837745 [Monomorium pharaonis]XP_036139248.1 uncharacterized protein LOC105837745 [Monomorium pharaonis]
MIDKRLQAYRTYQRFLKIVLTIGGCWHIPTKSSKFKYYWSFCMLLAMAMYATCTLNLVYNYKHNFSIFIKYVGVAVSAIGVTIKMTIFLINRDSLINFHRTLNDFFEEELMQNEKIRTIIFSSLRKVYSMGYAYVTIVTALVIVHIIPTYLYIIRDLCHLRLTTNYTLPLSKGYGYSWTIPDNFLYHLHLLIETILLFLSITTTGGVDSVFGFYAYQFTSMMHAMTFRFMNPLSTEKFLDLLKKNIKKHKKLLRCRDTLEHIYGPIIFYHTVTSAILLCSLIYELVHISTFNINNVSQFLTYTIVKLLQMFMYAWSGTMLTTASEDFRNGIYFSEWPNSALDCHVRTNVTLVMMQKPMTINAVFSSVNIVLFTNFVNTTMSYFFLLRSIEDKNG